MVLTDKQRKDLHAGIYEYLSSQAGDAFQEAARALLNADPEAASLPVRNGGTDSRTSKTPLLEKKWTAIARLQKKVLELERHATQSARIHAHRYGTGETGGTRRMLPKPPAHHALKGHSMGITSVALHPIFTVVASGSEDGTIKVSALPTNCFLVLTMDDQIWDHESGEFMKTMKGHTKAVNSVIFTPKGTHLASCSTDLSIKLWDVSSYTCLRTLRGHDHTISDVVFVPFLDANPNAPSSSSSTTTGVEASVSGCQQLLSASRDSTVKLWDVETGFCDHTFQDHGAWVRCLAVRLSDGAFWASAGNDQVIYVYDSSKSQVAELRGHEQVIESLSFVCEEPLKVATKETKHTDVIRDYLASASRDRSVRLWRVSDSSSIAVFKSHENWVQDVVIHPSGNYVISCADDKSIRVFDIKAQRCLRTIDKAHDHFITSLRMHHTLPILVTGSVDQSLKCWLLD